MIQYKDIQKQIEKEFDNFLTKLLSPGGQDRKYFYWSLDFFKDVGGLAFQYFPLSIEQKEKINQFGSEYFASDEISFEINKYSHRHELQIRNINKLFSQETKSGQSVRYEYLKEYILWDIFQTWEKDISSEIEEKNKLKQISELVKIQKSNFLFTYASYLCSVNPGPKINELTRNYIKYSRSSQGEELIKKLDELDRDYIYDAKEGKEIRKIELNQNPKLRAKIENLYILKSEESKLHFVFSHQGDEGKEELRELLDIMGGKSNSNHLYRGQANSSWILDASITREPKYLQNESQLYYDILSLKPDAFKEDHSVYERLITMQHYGMPTRLLDVSRNPLVAIFFACNNMECANQDGSLFIFSPDKENFLNFENKKLKCLVKVVESEEKEEVCRNCYTSNECPKGVELNEDQDLPDFFSQNWFVKGVAKNQRINNQSGDFIFVGLNGSQEKLPTLPKMTIIIDSDSKKVLLEQLETLNIHGGSVYPDITHMSNYIRKKYDDVEIEKTVKTDPEPKVKKEIIKKALTELHESGKTIASIPLIDFEDLKNKGREDQLKIFAEQFNLDLNGLEKLIQDFLITEAIPFRIEVAKIMKDPVSVLKEKQKIDSVIEDITKLAKILNE